LGNREAWLRTLSLLIVATKTQGQQGQQRDSTLILLMARHGLRVSEAVDLEWDQIDFTRARLHVRRLKGGIASVHPIQGDELRALREVRRGATGAFVFASERDGQPMTRSNVSKMMAAAGKRAGLPYSHPYMLRHTCGHLLAEAMTRADFSCGLDILTSSTLLTIPNSAPNPLRTSGNETNDDSDWHAHSSEMDR
jgi:integrase